MSAKSLTWFMNFAVRSDYNHSWLHCEACSDWDTSWTHEDVVSLHDLQEQAYLHYLNCRKAYQQ